MLADRLAEAIERRFQAEEFSLRKLEMANLDETETCFPLSTQLAFAMVLSSVCWE